MTNLRAPTMFASMLPESAITLKVFYHLLSAYLFRFVFPFPFVLRSPFSSNGLLCQSTAMTAWLALMTRAISSMVASTKAQSVTILTPVPVTLAPQVPEVCYSWVCGPSGRD